MDTKGNKMNKYEAELYFLLLKLGKITKDDTTEFERLRHNADTVLTQKKVKVA